MNIEQIIDYDPYQRQVIEEARLIGLDVDPFLNPDLTYTECANLLMKRKFNMSDQDFVKFSSNYGIYYDEYDDPRCDIKPHDIPEERYILPETVELVSKVKYQNYKLARIANDLVIHHEDLVDVIKEGCVNYICEVYYIMRKLDLPQLKQFKSDLKSIDPKECVDYIKMILEEISFKGMIDRTVDGRYDVKTRDRMLDFYLNTGIDLDVIPDFDKAIFESVDDTLEIIEKYSKEELVIYRYLSNKFREDRRVRQTIKDL